MLSLDWVRPTEESITSLGWTLLVLFPALVHYLTPQNASRWPYLIWGLLSGGLGLISRRPNGWIVLVTPLILITLKELRGSPKNWVSFLIGTHLEVCSWALVCLGICLGMAPLVLCLMWLDAWDFCLRWWLD